MKRTEEEYKQKLSILYQMTGIPVAYVSDPTKLRFLHPYSESAPDISILGIYFQKLIEKHHLPIGIPLVKSITFSTYYCIIRVDDTASIILGPVADHDINFDQYLPLLRKRYTEAVVRYHYGVLQGSPKVDQYYFQNYVILATDYLFDHKITADDFYVDHDISLTRESKPLPQLSYTTPTIQHLSLSSEIFHVIESGNLKRLEELHREIFRSSTFFYQKQSIYYLKIAFLFYGGIYCRAAYLGGANENDIKKCYDVYLSKMSECIDPELFWTLWPIFSTELCTLVHDSRQQVRHSTILKKAIRYIEDNIYSQICIEDLEQVTQTSRRTLLRHFKEYLHTTPSGYIQDIKLEEAAYLLRESDLSIIEISNMLAYSSQSHFTASFQKKYDTTPYQYRMSHS